MPAHGLRFESQYDKENVASFVASEAGLDVTVSEMAITGHNLTMHCGFEMRAAEAIRLRDWLITQFPLKRTH